MAEREPYDAFPAEDEKGGWCAPSHEEVFGYPDPLTLPRVQMKRGGIYWPKLQHSTKVVTERSRWWRREYWINVMVGSEIVAVVGPFRRRTHAYTSARAIETTMIYVDRAVQDATR